MNDFFPALIAAIIFATGLTVFVFSIYSHANKGQYDEALQHQYYYECMMKLEGIQVLPQTTSDFCMLVANAKSEKERIGNE